MFYNSKYTALLTSNYSVYIALSEVAAITKPSRVPSVNCKHS